MIVNAHLGDELHLHSSGTQGPDVVFIHGFAADRLTWLATTTALDVARVHTLDLPGHGTTNTSIDDVRPQALANCVVRALEQSLGEGPFDLVGHSLGGGIALLVAKVRPELVRSLFLLAPIGLGLGVDKAFLHAYPALNAHEQTAVLLKRLVVKPSLISDVVTRHALAGLRRPGARVALKRIADALVADEDVFRRAALDAAAAGVPRYVVWGMDDIINPPAQNMLSRFGDYEVLPSTGHLPHIESRTVVNTRLAGFVTRLDG